MEDPLSIAASVVGLLGAGAKLIALLSPIARQSDAPLLCRSALNELCDVAAALRQLQHFLMDHMAVPTEYRELVLLEQLAASLTGCVMTKDDLETLVDDLGLVYRESGISGAFDRVRWVRKEKDIEKLVQTLQNHKNSLNCMLTIFQANATAEIRSSVSRLYGLVEHAISNSSALSVRLARLESNITFEVFDAHSRTVHNADPRPGFVADNDTNVGTIKPLPDSQAAKREHGPEVQQMSLDFETELQNSRVYRKLRLINSDGHSETSITSSNRRRAAASLFSAVSLADMSNLSQYSLPILIQEVGNNRWYIQADRTGIVSTLSSPSVNLVVRTLDWRKITITMEPSSFGLQLKEVYKSRGGPPPDQVVLVHTHGSRLIRIEDSKTLAEQGILDEHPDARVHCLLRYRAGGQFYGLRQGRMERFSGG